MMKRTDIGDIFCVWVSVWLEWIEVEVRHEWEMPKENIGWLQLWEAVTKMGREIAARSRRNLISLGLVKWSSRSSEVAEHGRPFCLQPFPSLAAHLWLTNSSRGLLKRHT
jgi:GTP-dependent phosphoenolpyruvate carboxykinase